MKNTDAKALRISTAIHHLEDEIDRIIGLSGNLLADVAGIRVELDLDACAGQRPLQRLVEMQLRLAEARSKVTGAHSDMRKIAETRADIPVGCPDKTSGFLRGVEAA